MILREMRLENKKDYVLKEILMAIKSFWKIKHLDKIQMDTWARNSILFLKVNLNLVTNC